MTETTAKIRAKGLNATGFTETLATKYADSDLGQRFLAVVELKTEFVGEDAEGNRRLELIITQLEPAQNRDMEEHLRRLSRSSHYERKLKSADTPLPIEGKDDLEPKVKDVMASGKYLEQDQEPEAEPEPEPENDEGEPGPEDEPDEAEPYDEDAADLQEAVEGEHDEKPAGLPNHPYVTGCCDRPAESRIHQPAERHLAPVSDPFTPQAG